MTSARLLALLAMLASCTREPDQDCSVTCIGDGLAVSADVCSDELLRYKSCVAPELVRDPVSGEPVTVVSDGEIRDTIVLSVLSEGEFTIGGPPAGAELGSAIVALSDGALLGIVQSYSTTVSTCSPIR